MLLGMLWYYRSTRCSGVIWLLWDSAQTSTFFFYLPSWYCPELETRLFRHTVHISLSRLFACWVMWSWDAVPALQLSSFAGSPAKSYRAVSKHFFLWLWKCFYSAQTWPFMLWCRWLPLCVPGRVVREGLHKCRRTSPAKHLRDICCPAQGLCPSWQSSWKATLERYYWVWNPNRSK